MPLRVVGVIAAVVGLGLLGWTGYSLKFQREVAVAWETAGAEWPLPIAPEAFALRTNVLAAVLATCGVACIAGGIVLFMRKTWGTFVLLGAALLPILFPPVTRLLAPSDLRFEGPSLGDMLIFTLVALVAAMGWMFRSFSEVPPNTSLERTRER